MDIADCASRQTGVALTVNSRRPLISGPKNIGNDILINPSQRLHSFKLGGLRISSNNISTYYMA